MMFLSVCSGIEAASVAWEGLFKARALADVDAFANAVTAHHYRDVPNLGDLTKWRDWDKAILADSDILVGGTPCQAFSVAGLRNSLSDDRGNLSLEFVRLADAIDASRLDAGKPPAIVVWENVPGVLSVKDNAFGCFLAALAGEDTPLIPAGGRWTDAGLVDGPVRRIAWRILDAQYFGLAQRRRRVFVVASARDGFDPFEVLSECDGVQRYSPPRRETGQATPASLGNGPAVDFRHEQLTGDTVHTLQSKSNGGYSLNYMPGVLDWPADIAPTLNAHFGEKQGLEDQHIRGGEGSLCPPISQCLNAGAMGRRDAETETLIPTIGCGFDVAPSMTGGAPFSRTGNDRVEAEALIPVAVPLQEVGKRTGTSTDDPRAGIGIGQDGDPMFTLQAGAQHGVAAYAFQPRIARNGRGDMGEDVVNALQAQSGETGKGDAAPCVAVNIQASQSGVRINDTAGTLDANYGSRRHNGVLQQMAVRRLTPVECERLQGFPDGYTMIPWRNKPPEDCPDGPRYKALGNSMAVPVMRWIGQQIAAELQRASEKDKAA
jgi:DNA (cytosine-5)-methyltransferase 1